MKPGQELHVISCKAWRGLCPILRNKLKSLAFAFACRNREKVTGALGTFEPKTRFEALTNRKPLGGFDEQLDDFHG
jgi:hypothetical protein